MNKFILSGFADEADSSVDGQIKALTESGLSFIEIRNVNGKSIVNCTEDEISDLKYKFLVGHIKVSAIGSPIGKISIRDDFGPHLDLFKRTLEIAGTLQAKYIRMFSFFMPKDEKPEVFRDEVMDRINRILEAAGGSDVICCHENEKDIYGDIPERVMDLHKTFGGRLKAVFDPANYIQCGVDPLPAIKDLMPYIEYVHIKDARKKDGFVVPAGYGDGDIRKLLNILSKSGDIKILSVEPHLKVFPGYEGLGDNKSISGDFVYSSSREAFAAAVDALKQILADGLKYNEKYDVSGGYNIWTW